MTEVLAPLDRVGDTVGLRATTPTTGAVTTPPGFAEAYRKYVDAGWGGVPFDPEHGGGGLPVGGRHRDAGDAHRGEHGFSMARCSRRAPSTCSSHHGTEEQQERYLRRMVSGEWTGTMNLTEPEAGSDVGALRTKAVPADDGWPCRITGQKIFITYGEHD